MAFPAGGYADIAAGTADGLVYYWPFDEASGATFAEVVAGVGGYAHGFTVPGDTVAAGLVGNCRDASAAVTTGDVSAFVIDPPDDTQPPLSQFTVSLWFKIADLEEYSVVCEVGEQSGDFMRAYVYDATAGVLAVEYGYLYAESAAASISDGTWAMLTVTQDAVNSKAYLNGVQIGSDNAVGALRIAKGLTERHASKFGAHFYDPIVRGVAVDEAAMWSRALTQPEIADLWNAGAGTSIVIDVSGGAGGPISLPLVITSASAAQTISLPVRVSAVVPQTLSLPMRISAIDSSVVGGLDGAAGWAAAPGGAWQAIVTLDGTDISDRLTGQILVWFADDEARTAEFAFLPASTLQPMSLTGRHVYIAFAQGSGINAQPMFSGVVDAPAIEARTGIIRCVCTDQLQEVFSNAPRDWIDEAVGGRWHESVSGQQADNWQYMLDRLASVPASVALDVAQSPRVLPWRGLPRTLTVRDADVIDGSLSIELPSRDQMRTRIDVRAQYRYTRLRGRGIVAAFNKPFAYYASYGGPGTGLRLLQWPTVSMIGAATESLPGWTLAANPVITSPPSGVYYANPPDFGGYIIPPDVAPTLAMGFTAYYHTRWQQVVTETYEIAVTLPALESALGGPVAETAGATLQADSVSDDWSRDDSVAPTLTVPLVGDVSLSWQPAGAAAADRDEMLRTLLDRAWVRLYAAQRTGRVRWSLPARPDIWLDVWAQIESGSVRAAGKIVEGRHVLDLDTGEATSELAIAVGLPGGAEASLPSWSLPSVDAPDDTRPVSAYSCEIGDYVGGDTGSAPFDEDTMIGFCTNVVNGHGTNLYPHQLSIRSPEIAAEDRDPLDLTASAEIAVSVPTYLLEIDP